MTGRPRFPRFLMCVALFGLLAAIGRAQPPDDVKKKAEALTASPSAAATEEAHWTAAVPPATLPPVNPVTVEPPVRVLSPVSATPAARALPPVPDTPPAMLPPLPSQPAATVTPGAITIGGNPVSFDSLAMMVDGNGGGLGGVGCPTCGGDGCPPGRPCAAGARKCEPFPAYHNPLKRFVGLVYENVCCPDPCYQPKWEPIADSAFFVEGARPISNTRFRWDYGHHLTYPDRGEYFWARADGNGKGPKPKAPLLAVPYVDFHQLSLVTEIATGPASVAIGIPYRTVNTTPFGTDAAGFGDMTITAKTLLVDSELFLCSMLMRTYIPIGNFGKGLGVGHVSLEPGLIFGLRLTPETYVQAQVLEWIPIAGDPNYASALLNWGISLNHTLWQPVKDVQLIGTLELNGLSFQDGLFTDPVLGPQKLSGQNSLAVGSGLRLFFCNTMDIGIAGNFGVTGKYLVREQMRFEFRFRY